MAPCLRKKPGNWISLVPYPKDLAEAQKELRLEQHFIFVSGILRCFKKIERSLTNLRTKVAIQLNDTHLTTGIVELMCILMNFEGLGWTSSRDVETKVFFYTNHTVLPKTVKKWSVLLMEKLIPHLMQIMF